VALDLIFGRTNRDWSCGRSAANPAPEQPWARLPEVPEQAAAVRSLMSNTAATAIRLRLSGRLPEADWRAFGELRRRWVSLSDSRRGRWRESDSLTLWRLREACDAFAKKFSSLDELSRPRVTALAPTPPPQPPTISGPLCAALGTALALAGLGIYSRAKGN
jgi:hypothetical protein